MYQGSHDFIKMLNFCFGKRNSGTRFRKNVPIFLIGIRCKIKTFFKTAGITLFATVTNIRWFQKSGTDFFLKIFAEGIAHVASSTERIFTYCMADSTNVAFLTLKSKCTGIVRSMHGTHMSKDQMGPHFFGNGRRILI